MSPIKRPLFCCLSLFSVTGGIQRFNQRVLDTLVARAGRCSSEPLVHVLSDPAGTRFPGADLEAYSGKRSSFLRRAALRSFSSDALIIDHINLLPLAALVKVLRPRLPILMFAHGIEVWGGTGDRSRRIYDPAILKYAVNTIACVSYYTKTQMSRKYAVPLDRFHLLPNCVPRLIGGFSREEESPPVVLAVTRLDRNEPYKNVDKLILAIGQLAPRIPELTLQIVGDGTWRAKLERIAQEHRVSDKVRFLGRVSDEELEHAYRGATLFALPSTHEGFGIAYLEAWRQGLPVIGAAAGAAPEVIQDEVDGLLVEGGDVESLAFAIERLIRDKALRSRLASAGIEKVNSKYLYEHFASNLEAILDDLGRNSKNKPVRVA